MKSPDHHDLLDRALRRKLTPDEEARLEAYFAAHPEEQAAWEADWNLNQLLKQAPDAPLASNFTAQVLRLVEQDQRSLERKSPRSWWAMAIPGHWIRAISAAAAVVLVGFVFYHQHRVSIRSEVAQSVATVFGLWTVLAPHASPVTQGKTASVSDGGAIDAFPTLQMLEDFEAIKRLNQVPQEVDVELLAALEPASR